MTTHKFFKEIVHKLQGTSLPSPKGAIRLHPAQLGVGLLLLLLLLGSCARMGRPDGGWYDETPPHVVAASPADGGTNVSAKKVHIYFDEFIKLDNATEKVVVSPPQMEQAEIKSTGKQIEVELKDSLKANTTYTIDFSDAISDNNEGNPLGNYTYSFSTGSQIDTLEVSGHVLQADNLEPVKGILVGLYSNLQDSAFQKLPMQRVARTDSRGHFVIRGVAPGDYRIYALADMDGNYQFSQKSEQIAFSTDIITPSFMDAVRQDTVWLDSLHIKDINRVNYTRFTPDDIVLRAFTEPLTDRFFMKAERSQADHFSIYFSYGNPQLPVLKGLNFDEHDAFILEPSLRGDTITYWLRDTMLVNQDTLNIALSYLATDSLGALRQQNDTLQILSKQPYERRLKDAKKAFEEWSKKQEKRKKRGEPYDTVMPPVTFDPKITSNSTIDPNQNVLFEFDKPVAHIDTSMIHLYAKHDTLWYTAPHRFEPICEYLPGDTLNPNGRPSLRHYILKAAWNPGIEYSLEIDSTAFVDIYGAASPTIKRGLKVGALDDYSSIVFNIMGIDNKPAVVELLSGQDEPVKRASTTDGTAQFYYVKPGTYYARLFVDDNANGIWDTGDYNLGLQPEQVYYFNEEIECKAKWDVTRTWNVGSRPLNEQKPSKIVKQKADQKRAITKRNIERARKLGIDYPF